MISRRLFLASVGGFVLAQEAAAQPARMRRIGYLWPSTLQDLAQYLQGFRDGLRALGYFEGKNILIEYRTADGRQELLPALARELADLSVDVMVAPATSAAGAAKEATDSIPIVFVGVSDPVGSGFVTSFSRPGGNLTGLTDASIDLAAKRLDLLKQVVPRMKRVAVLGERTSPLWEPTWKEMQLAARHLRLELIPVLIAAPSELESAFAKVDRIDGLFVSPQPIFWVHRQRIIALVSRARLPATYEWRTFVEDGGLMSYGTDYVALHRSAARYVDRILKGAKPADLPVEQPTEFELVINLKTAKTLGLTVPDSVLLTANDVIR